MKSEAHKRTLLIKGNREGFERADEIRKSLDRQVKVDSGRASHFETIAAANCAGSVRSRDGRIR